MSVSDREESLEESGELIEDKPQDSESSSDHRISTTINESSEEETEVRVGLNKEVASCRYFLDARRSQRAGLLMVFHVKLQPQLATAYLDLCFVLA